MCTYHLCWKTCYRRTQLSPRIPQSNWIWTLRISSSKQIEHSSRFWDRGAIMLIQYPWSSNLFSCLSFFPHFLWSLSLCLWYTTEENS